MKMTIEEGIPVGETGIILHGSTSLGPPKVVITEGSFPTGDFKHWEHHYVPVFGISVDSFLDVYLQLNGEETNYILDQVADYTEKFPVLSQPAAVRFFSKKPGTPCLALFDPDESWYRARIVEDQGDDVYRVYFVDYGNYSDVKADKLMACPDELVNYIEGITHVAVHEYTGDESKDEVEALREFVAGKDLIAKIEANSFEIKGKTRMLVSLYTMTGDPVKTILTAEMKLKRTLPVNEKLAAEPLLKAKEENSVAVAGEDKLKEEQPKLVLSDVETAVDTKQEVPPVSILPSPTTTTAPVKTDQVEVFQVPPVKIPETSSTPEVVPVQEMKPVAFPVMSEVLKTHLAQQEKLVESSQPILESISVKSTPAEQGAAGLQVRNAEVIPVQLSVIVTAAADSPLVSPSELKPAGFPVSPFRADQFEDAVDGHGPVTIPRKHSLPQPTAAVNKEPLTALLSPTKLLFQTHPAFEQQLRDKEAAWDVERLKLEAQLQSAKSDLKIQQNQNFQNRQKLDALLRDFNIARDESLEKDALIQRQREDIQRLAETKSQQSAHDRIQHLEVQLNSQLAYIQQLEAQCNSQIVKLQRLEIQDKNYIAQIQQLEAERKQLIGLNQQLEGQLASQLTHMDHMKSMYHSSDADLKKTQEEYENIKMAWEQKSLAFSQEWNDREQSLLKEREEHKVLERTLRLNIQNLEKDLKECRVSYEQKLEKLSSDHQDSENTLEEAVRVLADMKKENAYLREQLSLEEQQQQEDNRAMKPRSRGGSFVDVSTSTPRCPGLPSEYEARVTEQKVLVEKLTETMGHIVRANALEAKHFQAKLDQLHVELTAKATQLSVALKHESAHQ